MKQEEEPLGTQSGSENPAAKHYEAKIYIFNLSEDVWPFISSISDPTERAHEIEENANLGDRDLFSLAQEDRITIVMPKPVSSEFHKYYTTLFNTKSLEILVPAKHSGVICDDILHDPKIMNTLVERANSVKKLTLMSYTTSPQFLELVHALRNKGISVYTPEAPEAQDAWTVNFYGSKSGFRQLVQQSAAVEPDLRMSDGFVCSGIVDAAKIATKMYLKTGGAVLKTSKGHSGAGVLIFRPGDLPQDYDQAELAILTYLRKDQYWDKFPIIIEQFISVNPSIGGGFPNVEFKVQKSGKVEFLYYCGMRISKNGVFGGVEISDDVVSDKLATMMMDVGFFVGERYAQNGYRGFYDVDFAYGKNGMVFATESNVRRTGGTHVYQTAVELFDKDFMYDTCVLSHNNYPLNPKKTYTFTEVLDRLQPIFYNKKTKEGIIVISENLLSQHMLAYIIFGNTKKRAEEIEAQMEELMK
ncbi:MAG: hypothetical protein UX04_C0002G0008 [Microgenomates group bacterium GW2011_GWF2_45_18]|nr:MAG: hypothetical protein UW18_C0001G0089 [Microgenomates group bacterium GW2011_GWF1_44_10]KKU01865.1 MAG: hypothetical protein UX04_C0002G0008 [Microgenomates group bacterium GW2011_GWF2_45_18]OGJ41111.1 MAG: hypothetical protein A2378_04490 [Candidatus Pacebacteria bacterium RIFOXYB1_FULL_44_10]HAU98818.1 hypothetical protein [Candidatus Paceibacterota bacterium]HAX01362.1 hypothetical protein [Candidatus Paceibacterota bacterium]